MAIGNSFNRWQLKTFVCCLPLIISSCSYRAAVEPPQLPESLPEKWQAASSPDSGKALANAPANAQWLFAYLDESSQQVVTQVLQRNFLLQANFLQLQADQKNHRIVAADRIPALDLLLSGQKNGSELDGIKVHGENYSLNGRVSWEVDLWGKLSAREQAALAQVFINEVEFNAFRLSLVANVTKSWFDLLEANELLELFQQRLKNLDENREIIEDGFKQGINDALDVYLARADVQTETARVAQQQLQVANQVRLLQLYLGLYPNGNPGDLWASLPQLPELPSSVPYGLPSDIISRRYDLRSALLQLEKSDAQLAAAYRARFPTFSLTASAGLTAGDIGDLPSEAANTWSVVGSVVQPLFKYGKLKAQQQQAALVVQAQEQRYLDSLINAFNEVETLINNEETLRRRYTAIIEAQKNALAAEQQSFELYQKGLVSYTTVLDSQRRAVDAQTSVIQLKKQQLQNRIDLHIALGGRFETESIGVNKRELSKN